MTYRDQLGNLGTLTTAAAILLVALTATRGAEPPNGTDENRIVHRSDVVSTESDEASSVTISSPSGPASRESGSVDAYISGREPVGAIVDSATDGDRGTARPIGGVADVDDPCTCDLDCGDGNPCTIDTCDPVTFLCVQAFAPAGDLCGDNDGAGLFCNQDTCDGIGACNTGAGGGGDPCEATEICNEMADRCDTCGSAGDCTADTNAIFCLTGDCVAGRCRGVSDCTPDEFCDTDGVANGTCTIDTNVRCCADVTACAPTMVADCDNGGGPGSGNYAHQMPFDDCTCPKYSSGINDNDGAELVWQLSATEQPCTLFNRVGDDYTIQNGSYLLMSAFRFVGGIDADGTGDGTIVFEFYDNSMPPILVFNAAVQFDPATDRGNNLWQITLTTPTVIPPIGYFVMRPGTGSGETVNLLSANAVGMEGMNNPDLLWVNDAPRAFLSPDDPDIMAFELLGTKTPDPLGGCCDPAGIAPCADTTRWVCDDLGFNWVDGVLCISDPCSSGACCMGDGTCTVLEPTACGIAGGIAGEPGTSCDPNCCDQPETGADMCDGATIHAIVVPAIGSPAVTTTITGDATTATGDDCTDFANDPVWWEAFHIDAGANVTIDYCCTDQGDGVDGAKDVRYIVLTDGCDPATNSCGDSTFRSADTGGCADGNPGDIWYELPAGTWYIPIYADSHCLGSTTNCTIDEDCAAEGSVCVSGATPYQMHITVEPLPLGGCCTVSDGVTQGHCVGGVNAGQACPPAACIAGSCVMEVAPACTPFMDAPACNAIGGIPIDNTTCTGAPCDLGSCCLEAGVCQDADGVGETYENCGLIGGVFFGGVRCIADDPCPICAIADEAHCQLNDGGFIVQSDRMLGVRWADDFKASTSGPINRVCWWPCWFNPNVPQECSAEADKPPDDFIVRWYADAGGLPGVELGIPGGEALTPDATSSIDGDRCWNYSAPVTTPPVVNAGDCYWIEITGHGDDATGCTVYWANNNTPGNNSYAARDGDGVWDGPDIRTVIGDEASDLAFCVDSGIEPGGCDHVAACCLPDLTCQDNMPFADCVAAAGVFKPGEVCGPDTCPIPCDNDDCVAAIDLNGPDYCSGGASPCSFEFTNAFCEPRPNSVDCQVTPDGPIESTDIGSTKWYTFTPNYGGWGYVSMCDSATYDAVLAVYDGGTDCSACPTNEADTLVCGDDTCGVGGGPPYVEFDALGGHCYFLSIGGWNGEQGSSTVWIDIHNHCFELALRPMPDARFGIDELGSDTSVPCTTTEDCLAGINANSEVECILGSGGSTPGTCYVRANKYISVDPNPENWFYTARRVSLDVGGGQTHVLGWMSAPVAVDVAGPEPSPQLVSHIIDAPVYLDWNMFDSVHLGDCEVSPRHTYIIESIFEGCIIGDPAGYSDPLTLSTVANFGDVSGSTVRHPPDTNRNFKDINAVVRGFQSVQKEPKVWLDLQGPLATPEVPDFSDISFTDINHAVAGFQGGTYPFAAPCDCPGQSCPPP